MRILGGHLRGRTIRAPRGQETRPVLARIREAYFNILSDQVRGARVADLFAGSGAIGLEAFELTASIVLQPLDSYLLPLDLRVEIC